MLNVDRFQNRAEGATSFWRLIKFLVEEKLDGKIIKKQDGEDIRQTHYRDTAGLELRRKGFILRVRKEGEDEIQYKTTLKYRAADRYISAVQDVSNPDVKEGGYKFEEDITPVFTSKFSHSSSIISEDMLDLKKIQNVTKLFPGLKRLDIPRKTRMSVVNTFDAYEVRRKIGQFIFDDDNRDENEMTVVKACLSFWYLQKNGFPLVGEFSFDYDLTPKLKEDDQDKLEHFQTSVVSGANNLFRTLQKQPGWFDLKGTTKTAYAYNAL